MTWLAGLVSLALLVCVVFGIKELGNARKQAVVQTEARASQAAEAARQAEAIRTSERQRVKRRLAARWYSPDGNEETWRLFETARPWPTTLNIKWTGSDTFVARFKSVIGPEVLHGELQPDNKLKLVNERQVGKIVQPGTYYRGDFAQEAWAELSADGSTLIVRFSPTNEGRALVMHRKTESDDSGAP